MKTYNVRWEESHSVNVEANNEDEAISKICNCEHDEGQEGVEFSAPPEAFEIKIKG